MPPLIEDHTQAINLMITADVAVEEDTILGHPALSAITIIITSMMTIAILPTIVEHTVNAPGPLIRALSTTTRVKLGIAAHVAVLFLSLFLSLLMTPSPFALSPTTPKFCFNLISVSLTLIHCKQRRFFSHTRHELMVFWLMIALNNIHPSQANLQHNVSRSGLTNSKCIFMVGKLTFEFRSLHLPTLLSTLPIYEIASSHLYSPQRRRTFGAPILVTPPLKYLKPPLLTQPK